jgi:hypothetical protein
MAVYSDNFNRANGSPSANWTAVNGGTWEIFNNELRQVAAGGVYRMLRWNGGAFDSANLYARVTGRSPDSSNGFGVAVRCPTSGTTSASVDGYALAGWPGDQWYFIVLTDAGETETIPLGGSIATNTNYTIEIRVNNNTITGFVNGAQVGEITRTTYPAGGAALLSYGINLYYDNFEAGDLETGRTGSLDVTQDAQSLAASGRVAVSSGGTVAQDPQTLGATVQVGVTAGASTTQGANSVTADGSVTVSATAALGQQPDLAAAAGGAAVVGSGGGEQATQTLAASGVVKIAGAASMLQTANTLSASGTVSESGGIAGGLNVTQEPQSLNAGGQIRVLGGGALAQVSHENRGSGAVLVGGQATLQKNADACAGAGATLVAGNAAVTAAGDRAALLGYVFIVGAALLYMNAQQLQGVGFTLTETPAVRGYVRGAAERGGVAGSGAQGTVEGAGSIGEVI